MLAVTCQTSLGNSLFVSTIVALHPVRALMEGHGNGTVLALQDLTARPAKHGGGISAAVQQDHGLLPAIQTLRNFPYELRGEYLVFSGALEFELHVHQLDLRQRPALYALSQL